MTQNAHLVTVTIGVMECMSMHMLKHLTVHSPVMLVALLPQTALTFMTYNVCCVHMVTGVM
eukprot:409319-Rhodomonas_salina.1